MATVKDCSRLLIFYVCIHQKINIKLRILFNNGSGLDTKPLLNKTLVLYF